MDWVKLQPNPLWMIMGSKMPEYIYDNDKKLSGNIKNLAGQSFGMLSVVSFAGRSRLKRALWECVCSCGTKTIVNGSNLRSGATKSCGCLNGGERLTLDNIQEHLSYNPASGTFEWLKPSKYHIEKQGKAAGSVNSSTGYVQITYGAKTYRAHQLAWYIVKGYIPKMIDHKNGCITDNRISNLRVCNHFQNAQNHGKRVNGSGLPSGVRQTPNGRYCARIASYGNKYTIGTYDTISEAHRAYVTARKRLHDAPREFECQR